MTLSFILWMDIVGTFAFAVSGAMMAIRKEMDVFGVNILALMTAVGGGALRDVFIGKVPPMMFQNPIYTVIAFMTANIVFFYVKICKTKKVSGIYEKLLFWFDTLGLGAFTADGVYAAINSDAGGNLFFVIFLGVITGVGGGVLRDIMANEMPYIFVKHVYACASIAGAVAAGYSWNILGSQGAMMLGFGVTIIIRILAAYRRWDLPHL